MSSSSVCPSGAFAAPSLTRKGKLEACSAAARVLALDALRSSFGYVAARVVRDSALEGLGKEVDLPTYCSNVGTKPLRNYVSAELTDAFNHPDKNELASPMLPAPMNFKDEDDGPHIPNTLGPNVPCGCLQRALRSGAMS